jgi:hypothetical protein
MNIVWVVVIDTRHERRWEVVAALSDETAVRLVDKGLPSHSSLAAYPVAEVTEDDLGTRVLTPADRAWLAGQDGLSFLERYLELKARLDSVRAATASPAADAEELRRAVEEAASTPWIQPPTDRSRREWLVSLATRSLADIREALRHGDFAASPRLQDLQREYAQRIQDTLDLLRELSDNW